MSVRIRAVDLVRVGPLGAAFLLAACSSSGGGSTAQAGGNGGGTAAPAAAKVELETQNGPLGSYLTDSTGKSIYLFTSDSATSSSCSGACLQFWPAVLAKGTVESSGNVSGKISTITRSDGTKQVVYAGHPLYYFSQDSKPGDVAGQGRDDFGAKWWLLTPAGQAITAAPPSSGSSAGTGGGGGYGGYP
jgi:predicted lipoprotein with Yx(FWY)xxD motif